mmetsp:Transcript_956/g.6013  ORF Transcript_956/g.6013 Transcript_956/m.6013 type:complete len:115 (+) Transcript_956:770-1114(+)
MQAKKVHLLPNADAQRRRTYDHLCQLRQLRKSLEVLLKVPGEDQDPKHVDATCVHAHQAEHVLGVVEISLPNVHGNLFCPLSGVLGRDAGTHLLHLLPRPGVLRKCVPRTLQES